MIEKMLIQSNVTHNYLEIGSSFQVDPFLQVVAAVEPCVAASSSFAVVVAVVAVVDFEVAAAVGVEV